MSLTGNLPVSTVQLGSQVSSLRLHGNSEGLYQLSKPVFLLSHLLLTWKTFVVLWTRDILFLVRENLGAIVIWNERKNSLSPEEMKEHSTSINVPCILRVSPAEASGKGA